MKIKHIHNDFFVSLNVIVNSIKLHMGKDTWAFKKPNDKLEALVLDFLHNHIKCYELHKCVKMTWNSSIHLINLKQPFIPT
jgi:hypothetical protein